jgi:hypothetical protein
MESSCEVRRASIETESLDEASPKPGTRIHAGGVEVLRDPVKTG